MRTVSRLKSSWPVVPVKCTVVYVPVVWAKPTGKVGLVKAKPNG